MATIVAARSAVCRFSVMSRTSGRETSSRRAWLEDTYARIAIDTTPMYIETTEEGIGAVNPKRRRT